ncbi:hypothetical protein [Sebaldella sp. S0638]|uniref:hypothetical protein n=1 Tax=Sebaldella sp. S0638 TaxID=2957809 RepID=UPI00209D2193|nr:hypothetical protein [Sebaldella sp. S0638]MCP1223791.1 hypothetical protein [Sebaldella sp. S0638]
MESGYPKAIQKFQNNVLKLKSIVSIESGVENLEGITGEALGLFDYAHLPHAALSRTNGGLENEVLCQFEFFIEKSEAGLDSLEFISWFFRDQARGGKRVQVRPFALPPDTAYGRQFGSTLRFHIDIFQDNITETLDPLFENIEEINKVFEFAVQAYKIPVKEYKS